MLNNFILILTAVTTGLMAGLFYSFTVSVMPGLKRLPDNEFIKAMQSINDAIQNPVFFIIFFGAPVLLLVSVFRYSGENSSFLLLLIAAIVYLTCVFGVTIFGNIPLNNTLGKFQLHSASGKSISAHRAAFEKRWNRFNSIRTIASLSVLILVILACLNAGI